jgi:hypothetical protein
MLATTLDVQNASISRPVGISNVRITESRRGGVGAIRFSEGKDTDFSQMASCIAREK